jgi:hypothetical protein
VTRNGRIALIGVALVLTVAALILRMFGKQPGAEWWQIALPGIVAATLVYLLIEQVRGGEDV